MGHDKPVISTLLAILLLALAFRLAPWGQNRFLEDEALYSYWGLQIATGADPMLDLEPVDKPPLFPYALALAFLASGTTTGGLSAESVARLPSLLASLASIALIYSLGRSLYQDRRVGILAAALLALSPYDMLFASTAFTDPLLVGLVLAALLLAARGRLASAGLLAGLAMATKQQAFFFLPLIVSIGALSPAHPSPARTGGALTRAWYSGWVRFSLGLALVAAGILWWDAARSQRPGFLEQSLISYGRLGWTQPQSLAQRGMDWLRLIGSFWASPGFNALCVGATFTWLATWGRGRPDPWTRIDLLLAVFVISFLLLHCLVSFQVWDRYLLGLVPLVALLAARAFVQSGEALRSAAWRRAYALALFVVLALLLTTPVLTSARSELPAGGDHGAYDGIDRLSDYVQRQAPPGAVLYHHWLGYHYRFYLYDTSLRLHWYPDPADLVHDATVYRCEARFITFPSFRDGARAQQALAEAGIGLVPVYETYRRDGTVSFRLYSLEGP